MIRPKKPDREVAIQPVQVAGEEITSKIAIRTPQNFLKKNIVTDDTEVRLAQQPEYPLEYALNYSINVVQFTDNPDSGADEKAIETVLGDSMKGELKHA